MPTGVLVAYRRCPHLVLYWDKTGSGSPWGMVPADAATRAKAAGPSAQPSSKALAPLGRLPSDSLLIRPEVVLADATLRNRPLRAPFLHWRARGQLLRTARPRPDTCLDIAHAQSGVTRGRCFGRQYVVISGQFDLELEESLKATSMGDHVIIVSKPSADATRRVRTGWCTPARSRSSVAHSATPWWTNARPISVHTEEHTRSEIKTIHASGGPRLQGWSQDWT